ECLDVRQRFRCPREHRDRKHEAVLGAEARHLRRMLDRGIEIADLETGERVAHLLPARGDDEQDVGTVEIGLQLRAPICAELEIDIDRELEHCGIEGPPQLFRDRDGEVPILGCMTQKYMKSSIGHGTYSIQSNE